LQSKNYLQTLANTWVLDSMPQNTVTDGLVLNLDALNKSQAQLMTQMLEVLIGVGVITLILIFLLMGAWNGTLML
jgi:hypothetical protein